LIFDTLNSLTLDKDNKLTQEELKKIFEPQNIIEVVFNKFAEDSLLTRGQDNTWDKFAEYPTLVI